MHIRWLLIALIAVITLLVTRGPADAPLSEGPRAQPPSPFGVFNVRDFGATGDGATDDAPSIQAGIDALGSRGGGAIFFPPGTYRINATILVRKDVNGVRLLGAAQHDGTSGGGTRIDNRSGRAAFDVQWQRGSQGHIGVQFEHFTIDSTAQPKPTIAIAVDHWNYGCWLKGMRIRNHEVGLQITDSILYGVYDSYFGDIGKHGIDVQSLGNAARYIGNTFVRNGLSAMRVKGNGVVVLNNTFEYTGYDGKGRVQGSDQVLALTTTGGGFHIAGNYFEENGDGVTRGRSNIFVTGAGKGGVIAGNYVDAIVLQPSGTAAIERNVWINNVKNVVVTGNTFQNASVYDLLAGGGSSDVIAWGNSTTAPIRLGTERNMFSKLLSEQATLNFAAPAAVPGSVDLPVKVPGVALGDEAIVAGPRAVGSNYILTAFVSGPDTVTVRWTQLAGTATDPDGDGGIYRVTVIKH